MVTPGGTAVTTRTQVEFSDDFDDFDAAWASVQKVVMDFARKHPGARITIDTTTGLGISITILRR